MNSRLTYTACVAAVSVLFASCATTPPLSRQAQSRPAHPRLSEAEVKRIVVTRTRGNGFETSVLDPWNVSFRPEGLTYVWAAYLNMKGLPEGFLLNVDDSTGNAEFLTPIFKASEEPEAGVNWLNKVSVALQNVSYPLKLETLMQRAHFTKARSSGGGTTSDGRMYVEYTLQKEFTTPARFEVPAISSASRSQCRRLL